MGRRLRRQEVQTGQIDRSQGGSGGRGNTGTGGNSGGTAVLTAPVTGTGGGTRAQRRARQEAATLSRRATAMMAQASTVLRNAGLSDTGGTGTTTGGAGTTTGQRLTRAQRRAQRRQRVQGGTGTGTGTTGTTSTVQTGMSSSEFTRLENTAIYLLAITVSGREMSRFSDQDWVNYTNQAIYGAATLASRLNGFRGYTISQIRDRVRAGVGNRSSSGSGSNSGTGGGSQVAGV